MSVPSSELLGAAWVAEVAAVEVRIRIVCREAGLGEHDPQQRPELPGRVATEVVRRSGDEVAANLPLAAASEPTTIVVVVAMTAVTTRGGEERVELRPARRIDAVRAGLVITERRVELSVIGLERRQVGLERDRRVVDRPI